MTSFVRTIPIDETPEYIEEILNRKDDLIPLPITPKRASEGDFIYLVYSGKIVGRAKISELFPYHGLRSISGGKSSINARCLVIYKGNWSRPPLEVKIQGFQGIRYLDTLGLLELDYEEW